ncbi:hypothetical protein BC831DRAFT_512330 [Entophlyctis helioformis]|nr:hypothetical protein BC831DRAFT_512330 [Entophlyctis helioformis]
MPYYLLGNHVPYAPSSDYASLDRLSKMSSIASMQSNTHGVQPSEASRSAATRGTPPLALSQLPGSDTLGHLISPTSTDDASQMLRYEAYANQNDARSLAALGYTSLSLSRTTSSNSNSNSNSTGGVARRPMSYGGHQPFMSMARSSRMSVMSSGSTGSRRSSSGPISSALAILDALETKSRLRGSRLSMSSSVTSSNARMSRLPSRSASLAPSAASASPSP